MKKDTFRNVLILALLAAIPFREGLLYGKIVGAGPDVISTLWGMWWFQQEGVNALFGKETHLVNFPQGAIGIVLSPVSAMIWSVLEPMVGIGRALALTNWVQIFGFAWGGMWFAGVCGVEKRWTVLAGIAILSARFLVFSTGEASVVAIVALSLPIGFGQMLLAREKKSFSKHHLYVALCAIFLALENPYLAPVLPLFQFLLFLYPKTTTNPTMSRKPWFFSCVISAFGILSIAHAYGAAANPNYPREVTGQMVRLFGRSWSVVDLPWARLKLWELVVPNDVAWTTSTNNAISATGGRYLGVVFTLLSTMIWHRKCRTPLFLVLWSVGCLSILIAMGSEQQQLALPFLFLNDIMDAIARPLTQPTRFLIVTILAFSVCIAQVISMIDAYVQGRTFTDAVVEDQSIEQKVGGDVVVDILPTENTIPTKVSWVAIGVSVLMVVDGFAFGGLGLRPPNTEIPFVECDIPGEGAVLLWPEDGLNGELGLSRLVQMQHGHPTPQMGIASWKTLGPSIMSTVKGAGFSLVNMGRNWDERRLYELGFTYVLVGDGEPAPPNVRERLQPCGDFGLLEVQR